MSDSQRRLLQGFAEYEDTSLAAMHSTIGVRPGTRLMRIVRLSYGFRLWLATRDYIHGTYMELHDNGQVVTFITRVDEGDETILVRPSDEEIRQRHARATTVARGISEDQSGT